MTMAEKEKWNAKGVKEAGKKKSKTEKKQWEKKLEKRQFFGFQGTVRRIMKDKVPITDEIQLLSLTVHVHVLKIAFKL